MAKGLNEDFIENLWKEKDFKPSDAQKEAIFYRGNKPLFITAAPGSGKTRVLLWRTLTLIVVHGVKPEEIYLSTFTEKAAFQLKEGLKGLLGLVSNHIDVQYDLSSMALGTIHSNCNRILTQRRFSKGKNRVRPPRVIDESSQYFYIYKKSFWNAALKNAGFSSVETAHKIINKYLADRDTPSKHHAVTSCMAFFSRLSEEMVQPETIKTKDEILSALLKMYSFYLNSLSSGPVKSVDLSLMQQAALEVIENNPDASKVFKHVIIDEYQDTNAVQEKLFFTLAKGTGNLCVVGDDDQALYRFRGATVENFVDFEKRCVQYLNVKPKKVNLCVNYRSQEPIVDCYCKFINLIDWAKDGSRTEHYRVADKKLDAHRKTSDHSVVVTSQAHASDVYEEMVDFVESLKKEKKIEDYNQVAFLFPYLKGSSRVRELKEAFEARGIRVYAPRAGRFLAVEEAKAVFGLFLKIFGIPDFSGEYGGRDIDDFRHWLSECGAFADTLIAADPLLKQYIQDKVEEIQSVKNDFVALIKVAQRSRISLDDDYKKEMIRIFLHASGLSDRAKRNLTGKYFQDIIEKRIKENNPFKVKHIINRATALDWTILDLFYQLNGFKYFLRMYELAQKGEDEGPICNLGLITQYLSRYIDNSFSILVGSALVDNKLVNSLFLSYCFSIFRLQESEYEDAEDPFPKGRVSFLTIHQAKGLEFPVVILGSLYKKDRGPSNIEVIVRGITKKEGEPLEKSALFDIMRMFYVALSRSKNILLLPRYKGPKAANDEFKRMLSTGFPELKKLKLHTVPEAKNEEDDLGKAYSYTADYLTYKNCPRNYMVFQKYGFVPSRTQTMFFGNLVHLTIEDLHNYLIAKKEPA